MDDLIRRQDAINAFREDRNSNFPRVFAHISSYNEDDLLMDIEQLINNLPSAYQWIPVTEQTLPNHGGEVVVCGEKGTWDFGTYRGLASTNINFWNWKNNTVKEVHWWMYKEDALPMPWKGEEDA